MFHLPFFKSRYESKDLLQNYVRSQYGTFLVENNYEKAESFYQKIIHESKAYVSHDVMAIDVGCATGRLVFEWLNLGASEAYGIDNSKKFIDYCINLQEGHEVNNTFIIPQHGVAKFIHGDVLELSSENISPEFISCVNLVDRVKDPQKLINILHNVLKPKGILVLVDPYDWKLSPAPSNKHVTDMKLLIKNEDWTVEKEIRDISYAVPVSKNYDKSYSCHLLILRKR